MFTCTLANADKAAFVFLTLCRVAVFAQLKAEEFLLFSRFEEDSVASANPLHTEAKHESVFVHAVKSPVLQVTTLTEMWPFVFTRFLLSAPVGGGTGSQQTILHEEQ